MANEISITASMTVFKPSIMAAQLTRSIIAGTQFNMTGNGYVADSFSVPITATQIGLGSITTPGWAFFRNMDTVNNIGVRNGAGNADFILLYPGAIFEGPLAPACTPYAISYTAPCFLEYFIASL